MTPRATPPVATPVFLPVTGAPRVLALVGPTASGKTGLSLDVAEALDAEIVSMDSRQVYRGMDIGTAKAGPAERTRVPHHGLDLVDPDEGYSAGRFARDARGWIEGIESRGRLPLLVGGTGFFLRALTDPVFREPPMDPERVDALRRVMDRMTREELEDWVAVLDPERAAVASEGGPQRLGRTLEVALLTGRPLSWWHREAPADAPAVPALTVVLDLPRELLDRRIDERVLAMIEEGLVDEVRGLLEAGYGAGAPGMSGVGYREVVRVLEGAWTLDRAVEGIQHATRRYARRQLTWFRNQLPPQGVLRLDATEEREALVRRIVEAWQGAIHSAKGGAG